MGGNESKIAPNQIFKPTPREFLRNNIQDDIDYAEDLMAKGKFDKALAFIKENNINLNDGKYTTLLQKTTILRDTPLKFVQKLLDMGADPNGKTDFNPYPPIIDAITRGRIDIVKLLKQRGARIDILPLDPGTNEPILFTMLTLHPEKDIMNNWLLENTPKQDFQKIFVKIKEMNDVLNERNKSEVDSAIEISGKWVEHATIIKALKKLEAFQKKQKTQGGGTRKIRMNRKNKKHKIKTLRVCYKIRR